MVPTSAVEHGTVEAVQPLDVGVPRMMEHAGGGDDHVGFVLMAGLGGEVPPAIPELAPGHGIAEADVGEHTV